MKILALSPFEMDVLSGNVVTLRRIQRGISEGRHSFENEREVI